MTYHGRLARAGTIGRKISLLFTNAIRTGKASGLMNAQKLCVKLFLKDPAQLHGVKLVPVFQSWIQMHAVEDHLAIDVADYEHVPDGPGTVLVTHEANFSLDNGGGRPGLLYQRKQPLPGTFGDRLATIF